MSAIVRFGLVSATLAFAASAWPLLAHQQAPPAAPPIAPAQAEPEIPALDLAAIEAARAARLAADHERYASLVASVDRWGRLEEFGAALSKLLKAANDRFIDIGNGYITDVAVQSWLEWNVPREGGPVLPVLDTKTRNHPYTTIVDLSRQLRAKGIDFLLVTFPTRLQLYPEFVMPVDSFEGFSALCPATSRLMLALNEAGVDVLDLAPEFVAARYGPDGDKDDQLFLRYNQHWTPRAAEMTARLVTERLAKFPWFRHGPAKEGVDWVTIKKEVSVAIVYGGAPPTAKPEKFHVNQVVRPRPSQKIDSVRPSSPIALLSGSFADFHGVQRADFTSQLYRYSGWAIDKINPKGGIEDACRQALADRPDEEVKKKKLVIWMLAEQAFRTGEMWAPIKIFDE